MSQSRRRLGAAVALGCVLLFPARALSYEQPRNTISLGLQGQYGYLNGETEAIPEDPALGAWASLFEFGEGIALRVRYSLARNRAVGLSFEDQRFRRLDGLDDSHPKQVQLSLLLVEYYFYFHRPQKLSRYLVVGGGLHRPVVRIKIEDEFTGRDVEEAVFPGEDLTLTAGGGLEYFLGRRTAVDLSLRGYAHRSDPGLSATAQVALGIHYYTK